MLNIIKKEMILCPGHYVTTKDLEIRPSNQKGDVHSNKLA